MAEIKIEKKKPIWPWVLLLSAIVIAAIIYITYEDPNPGDVPNVITTEDADQRIIDDTPLEHKDSNERDQNRANFQDPKAVITEYNTIVKNSTLSGTYSQYTQTAFNQINTSRLGEG